MKISPFLATSFAGGGEGEGRREEPKADQKIVIRSSVLCNNYFEEELDKKTRRNYSETCIKRTVAEVPKFISLIYFK